MPSGPTLLLADVRMPTVNRPADAVRIAHGSIEAIGSWRDLKRDLPSNAVVHDLAGATVLPGLGDAHVHFAATGFLQSAIDCSQIDTLEGILAAVAREAAGKGPGELVLGLRMQHLEDPAHRLPTRQELTAAAPANPVYIRHITGHASVANERVFDLLDFPQGQAGVVLDEDGWPSGYLVAQATQQATQAMYDLYAQQVGYEAAFRAAADKAAREGCTVVHALDNLGAVEALLPIEPSLPVRVLPYTQSWDLHAVRDLGLTRIGGCHGCALDGDFDMGTAAVLEPYANRPGHTGVLYHDDVTLQGFVNATHHMGMQLCFHAVGDRAVEQALTAFERAERSYPRGNARHRIEHAQLITPGQIARAAELGAVVSVQPAFNHVWDHHTYIEYVGETYRRVDPLRSLLSAGLQLAGGSDSTVTELRPLLGIHAAVNHSREEERIGVGEAIRLFSEGVAYSTFDEGRRGAIRVGFDADLTVVDRDPFAVDPASIADITPVMTVVRGRVVHGA